MFDRVNLLKKLGEIFTNTSSSLDKHELHLFLQLILCDIPDLPVYVFIGA